MTIDLNKDQKLKLKTLFEKKNYSKFESEVEKLSQYTRHSILKKISIYGEQSTHDHKDDKAIILTIKI